MDEWIFLVLSYYTPLLLELKDCSYFTQSKTYLSKCPYSSSRQEAESQTAIS